MPAQSPMGGRGAGAIRAPHWHQPRPRVWTPMLCWPPRWEGLDRSSAEYKRKKEEAATVLWEAIERQIPDVRQRAKVTLVGTPLTHERFLRRERGSYGPFLSATDGMLPMQGTGCPGFFCCGDSTFPGIGMPAAAASGLIAANSVVSVAEHWKMLDKIRF